ncbi:unnamed protein product [Colias eurytheme]|nr:unnamed protein product [Colias eurytheme]
MRNKKHSILIEVKSHIRRHILAFRIYSTKKNLPLIGAILHFSHNAEHNMETLQEMSQECSENGGILKFCLGPVIFLMMTDPLKIDVILKNHLEKDNVMKFIRSVIGNGSLFATVPIWRRRRKTMISTLSPKNVANHFETFLKLGKKVAEDIAHVTVNKEPHSLWPYFNYFSFDVICETAIGTDAIKNLYNHKETFLNSIMVVKDYLSTRILSFWLHPDWIYRFHKNYANGEYHKNTSFYFIEQAIEHNLRSKITEKQSDFSSKSDRLHRNEYKKVKETIFLNHLINYSRRKKEYNNIELREELMAIFLAATDTSSIALVFVLKLLAKYPAVQKKVYEELYSTFKDQDMLPKNKDDILKLAYLDCVLKETLRLFPPAPFIVRKINKETVLPNGTILPENSSVVVSIWGLHRNKKYWGQDANSFDPDRFLPERFKNIPPGCYIPFSYGPRNCPGYAFAMMSIKTALCVILKTYRVLPDPEDGPIPHIRTKFDITMTLVDDKVALERR